MNRRFRVRRLLVVLVACLLPALSSPQVAVAGILGIAPLKGTSTVLDGVSSEAYGSIDVGDKYSVAQHRNGGCWDIAGWYMPQSPPAESLVTNSTTDFFAPTVHDDLMAYAYGSAIGWRRGGSPASGYSFPSLSATTRRPSVYGDIIVFSADHDGNGNHDIYYKDVATGGTAFELLSTGTDADNPDIWGDVVVWDVDYGWLGGRELFYKRLGDFSARRVSDTPHYESGDQRYPKVWGEWIVLESQGQDDPYVVAQNMLTGQLEVYGRANAKDQSPSVFNDHLVYMSTDDDGSYNRLVSVDLVSGEQKVLWQDGPAEFMLSGELTSLSHDHVGWSVYRPEDFFAKADVHAARLVKDVTPERIQGDDRYETAVEISKESFGWMTSVPDVFIATGENFPDALAGSALAGALQGPILLTPRNGLPSVVKNELQRLKPWRVHVLGGDAAVSDETYAAIQAAVPNATMDRIEGADRYATAREIAKEVAAAVYYDSHFAFVATGANFPDALAASPIAVSQKIPIFLAEPAGISGTTIQQMKDHGITDVYMLGGPPAVGQETEDRLQAAFGLDKVRRLWGDDRYETAAEVARFGVEEMPWTEWCGVTIATGETFPDALSGGVLAGRRGTVLLMTPKSSLAAETKTALTTHAKGIPRVTFFGSEAAVSGGVVDQVVSAVD